MGKDSQYHIKNINVKFYNKEVIRNEYIINGYSI